jgi:RHS repeat-associated protein
MTGYAFDHNGNTIVKTDSTGNTSYTWDYENRMTSVILPGSGGTVSFLYDPFGRRIYKSSSSATRIYAYDGDNLVEEINSSGTAVARYSQGLNIDEPLVMLRGGSTSYYEADGLGSVTSLTNAAGTAAQTYTYDSFGNTVATSGSLVNSFQYTGREFDPETSLYYYRARYYDSTVGRFSSEDPIRFLGGRNFFAYVANEPTIYADPMGLASVCHVPAVGPHSKLPVPVDTCAGKDLINCVIQTESGGNPNAKSLEGASGIMQTMPGIPDELKRLGLYTPGMTDLQLGTAYLNVLISYCDSVAYALAAYNWSPGKLNKNGGDYSGVTETTNYVKKIDACMKKKGLTGGVNDPAAAGGCACK